MRNIKLALAVIMTIIALHTKAQNQKPNIILILADDVGYRSLTYNGGNLYSTPNIDTLAKKGMRFTQCHGSPSCSPSRHLLLTGKYNFRNYINWGKMDVNQKTIGNMMKDAGYKTACFGKWQLDGGDQSIHKFGFDSYAVHDPLDAAQMKSRYKNPHIYTNGVFLPDSLTLNKYGPDIISDSVLSFIESNKTVPFFIYYPLMLCHGPFQPTPDDADFADGKHGGDTSYYPSMMKYMDKLIGKTINKIKETGIENNTVIIFVGDNGTSDHISEYTDDDSIIMGGKWSTKESGTHVPLIAYWPGTINPETVNHDLIDFTDFLPTLAGITNTPVPSNYGALDGISFSPRFVGKPGTPRDWIFNDYAPHQGIDTLKRWAQTKAYKLYDTSAANAQRLFYNIKDDINEEHPIADAALTDQEIKIKQQLLDVINGYVAQGKPFISSNPSLSFITDSSVVLAATIKINGGSTVTASGAVWSTSLNPKISSCSHTSSGVILGSFSTQITGLTANTLYYVTAYATNFAGTVYSNQAMFKTLLKPPVATKATEADSNKFTANWITYAGAKSYRLDVSKSSTFTRMIPAAITEGFDNGIIPAADWSIKGNIITDTSSFGEASPSLEFVASKARVVTQQLNGPATQLKFWIKGLGAKDTSSLLVEGFNGNDWVIIANLIKLSKTGVIKTFNANSNPPLEQNFIQFRFTYTKSEGNLLFDDVSIKYTRSVPYFVPGYNNLLVKTNSKIVTDLKPATTYYYRVQAKTTDDSTGNSNVIAVTTKKATSIIDTGKLHSTGTVTDSDTVNLTKRQFAMQVFPNPSPGEFMLTLQTANNERTEITVMDMHGKILYRATGNSNSKFIFGKTFASGEYFVSANSGKLNKTIKIIKAN